MFTVWIGNHDRDANSKCCATHRRQVIGDGRFRQAVLPAQVTALLHRGKDDGESSEKADLAGRIQDGMEELMA